MAREPTPASAFRQLDRRSLAHEAAEQLRRLVQDGTLKPGDKLPSERELSARLGVSRPTLREAVRAMVIIGMLETRHGAGTFVTHGAPEHENRVSITIELDDPLESLFELRLLVEPVAAERAAAHITAAELEQLRELLGRMAGAVDSPDDFVRIDAEFHRCIHRAAQSELIVAVSSALEELAMRGRRMSGRQPDVTRRTVGEHESILDALQRGDPFEARAVMTAHLMHIRGSLIGLTT